jgi:hypothetical protein
VVVVVSAILLGYLFNKYIWSDKKKKEDESKDDSPPDAVTQTVVNMRIWQYYYVTVKELMRTIMIKFKTLIATYQIVTSTPSKTLSSSSMPSSFTKFVKIFGVSNLNIASLFPFGCSV